MNKKVIAFPFAGGNKHCYDFLKNHVSSQNVEIHTMEYPGRGSRIKESLLVDIYSLIDDLYEKVLCLTDDSNYILFGHSMGGLVAYLLAKKIEKHDDNPPFKLIVSGRTPPSIVKDEEISNLE